MTMMRDLAVTVVMAMLVVGVAKLIDILFFV